MKDVSRPCTYTWVTTDLNGTNGRLFLIDTGASISLLPLDVYEGIDNNLKTELRPCATRIRAGNNTTCDTRGEAEVDVIIDGKKYPQLFCVCADATAAILGVNFQKTYDMYLRPATNELFLGGKKVSCYDNSGNNDRSRVECVQHYVIEPNEEAVIQGRVKGYKHEAGRPYILESTMTSFAKTGLMTCRVTATPTASKIPVRVINLTDERVRVFKGTIVAALDPVAEIRAAPAESPDCKECTCGCECDKEERSDPVETVCCHTVDKIPSKDEKQKYFQDYAQIHTSPKELCEDEQVPAHVKELYLNSLGMLKTQEQKNRLASALRDYADCFAKHPDDIGRTTMVKHHIDTGDAKPVKQRCRRFCKAHIDVIRSTVKKLGDAGIIRPSTSNWAVNPVVVKKKGGEDRLCMDYRPLNGVTVNPDSYMLPRIDDTLDALAGAKYFCTLDLIQGYHQVELTEESKQKTAFYAPYCNPSLWEYNYMPFGLVRAPRTFQRLMDRVIQGLEFDTALCYLDDIIVFGSTIDETMARMTVVFDRLKNAGLKMKAKKCLLFQTKVKYLGHVITADGIATDPDKVKDVLNWHAPKTTKHVRSFMGMVNYYSRFIRNLAAVARPLHELTKKNVKFKWTPKENRSFEDLKTALASAEVMAYPRRNGMFILDTDASNYACGAVLSQVQVDGTGQQVERPIAYASKKFDGREAFYCARRREMLAIIKFVKHFNVYLKGPTFMIRTDHASLRYIRTVTDLTAQFFRWIMFLEEYSYKIEIRKGVLHANADGMSRGCHGSGCICDKLLQFERKHNVVQGTVLPDNMTGDVNVFECTKEIGRRICDKCEPDECLVQAFKLNPDYSAAEIAKMQEEDPDIKPVLLAYRQNPDERPKWDEVSGYSTATKSYFGDWDRLLLHGDALYRSWESKDGVHSTNQVIVPKSLQQVFCERIHDSAAVAHMGRRRTLHALRHFCFWYKMYTDVSFWVRTCEVCQRRKPAQPKPKAPMKIVHAGTCNQRIAMDICGPLIKTATGKQYVLVITDYFSKHTEAFAMKDQTAETVAKYLVQRWILRNGQPLELHTDQGRNFESELIHQICNVYDIKKTKTTAYHPQGDGQVERYNKTMMTIVNALVQHMPEKWDEALPFATAAYNGTVHETTGFTPNYMWYMRECRTTVGDIVPNPEDERETTTLDYVKKMRDRVRVAHEAARQAIKKKAIMTKEYYDRDAYFINHKPGSRVMLTDHAPKEKGTRKIADFFIGPYWVLDRIGDVNFRIQRYEVGKPMIVHHNRLKKFHEKEMPRIPEWVVKASKSLSKADKCRGTATQTSPDPEPEIAPAPDGVDAESLARRLVPRTSRPLTKPKKKKARAGRPKRPKPNPIQRPVIAEEVAPTQPQRSRYGRQIKKPQRYS